MMTLDPTQEASITQFDPILVCDPITSGRKEEDPAFLFFDVVGLVELARIAEGEYGGRMTVPVPT